MQEPIDRTWSEKEIITVWMQKWYGKTDREVAQRTGHSLRSVKLLIRTHEMFWHDENSPSWLPSKWYERFINHLDR